jgi:peroxiredoxin
MLFLFGKNPDAIEFEVMLNLKASWKSFRSRYWQALAFDVAVIMVAFWLIHAWNTRNLPNNEPAPALQLAQLDAGPIARGLPSGRPGVVYFFAPWCFYCRNSIDNLDELVRSGDIAWARAVALDYDSLDEVRDFVDESGLQQPVLLGDRQTALNWSIRAFPTYFVIDAQGRISSRSVGYSTKLGLWMRVQWANGATDFADTLAFEIAGFP